VSRRRLLLGGGPGLARVRDAGFLVHRDVPGSAGSYRPSEAFILSVPLTARPSRFRAAFTSRGRGHGDGYRARGDRSRSPPDPGLAHDARASFVGRPADLPPPAF